MHPCAWAEAACAVRTGAKTRPHGDIRPVCTASRMAHPIRWLSLVFPVSPLGARLPRCRRDCVPSASPMRDVVPVVEDAAGGSVGQAMTWSAALAEANFTEASVKVSLPAVSSHPI